MENIGEKDKKIPGKQIWFLLENQDELDQLSGVSEELVKRDCSVEMFTLSQLFGPAAHTLLREGVAQIQRILPFVKKTESLDLDIPDLIVTTSPSLSKALRLVPTYRKGKVAVTGIMTSFDWDTSWFDGDFDQVIVPHEKIADEFLESNWKKDRVVVAGPPLPLAFSDNLDEESARTQLGLNAEEGVIIVVDVHETEPKVIDRLVFQFTLPGKAIQPIFYYGDNTQVANGLRKSASSYGLRARMFGRVSDIENYYAASHIVMTPPNSPHIISFLAMNRPLILFGKQSKNNHQSEFLVQEGVAKWIPNLLQLGADLDVFLHSEDEISKFQSNAEKTVTCSGSRIVGEVLFQAAVNKDILRSESALETGESQPDPEAEIPFFENIGGSVSEPRTRKRRFSPISQAQAQDELASLILRERELRKKLEDAKSSRVRWEERCVLARERSEPELLNDALRCASQHRRDEQLFARELASVGTQRDLIKKRFRVSKGMPLQEQRNYSPQSPIPEREPKNSGLESRFREIEVDKDLELLRKRIRDEYKK